jgi:hypothetical protein
LPGSRPGKKGDECEHLHAAHANCPKQALGSTLPSTDAR